VDLQERIDQARAIVRDTYGLAELKAAGFLSLTGDFAPCIHYPPSHRYPVADEQALYRDFSLDPALPLGVYLHIPFCLQRCVFCHFVTSTTTSEAEKDRYLDTLEREVDLFTSRFGFERIKAKSVLVGGGTPTHLSPRQLGRFLAWFTSRFDLSSAPQISWDVDPLTLVGHDGWERLRMLRDSGADRLTIGVQAFDDDLLRRMNRPHDADTNYRAVEQARRAGFDDICVELIYGYAGVDQRSWLETVSKAIGLGVEEIQQYRLKVIPYGSGKGLIGREYAERADEFPADEDTLVMKMASILTLNEAGYHETLTRVFSKSPRYRSQYTYDLCCNLDDMVGFGVTAYSVYQDRFCRNSRSFESYHSLVAEGKLPIGDGKIRTEDDQLRWALTLPLKNWRVARPRYSDLTGRAFDDVFGKKRENLRRYGIIRESAKTIALTEKGRFFADEACHQFYHPDHIPFPQDDYADGPLNPYRDTDPLAER